MGGPSAEHDVSLASAREVIRALDSQRYDVRPLLVARDQHHVPRKALADPDVAFIAIHGEFGEDGTIQGILEAAGVPYTGADAVSSALAFDKSRAAAVLREAGLYVPEFSVLEASASLEQRVAAAGAAVAAYGLSLVVKPTNRGSSVGVTIVRSVNEVVPAIETAFRYSDTAMLQRFVAGTEVTCGILEVGGRATALPPTEIVPKTSAFFDYDAKYTPCASEEITPARLPPDVLKRVRDTAVTAHRAIGCSGFSRTDMIVTPDGALFVLELNTIPGLTPTSLLPQGAAAAGIPFPNLLDHIINAALQRARTNSRMDTNVTNGRVS
jgi:D-alanine-D-alanine ligase